MYSEQSNGSKPVTFSTKSSTLVILLGPENASGFTTFNYFHQTLHLRSLRGLICPCIHLVQQFWRWINEISKVCYEETQTIALNMLFLRIAVQKMLYISKKTSPWNYFFKQSCRLPDTCWESSSGNLCTFKKFSQKTPVNGGFCN